MAITSVLEGRRGLEFSAESYMTHTETSYLYNTKDVLEMTLASFGKDLGSSIF